MTLEINQSDLTKLLGSLDETGLSEIKVDDLRFKPSDVIKLLSADQRLQSPSSKVYKLFKKLLIAKYAMHYKLYDSVDEILGVKIDFPFISFGAINSRHFFGIDELLIYDFYIRNISRYKKVADIGCNCGLHSKILCELGYIVDSYEPDITHSEIAKKYLQNYSNNTFYQTAVSSYTGKANFTRIINNSTGSYINDKKESYGPTEVYEVDVINALELSNKYDLIKIDIEGSEADVFSSFEVDLYSKTDVIAEVSTEKTRTILWDLFEKIGVKVYAQKIGWELIQNINDLPSSHREGSIFISQRNTWLG